MSISSIAGSGRERNARGPGEKAPARGKRIRATGDASGADVREAPVVRVALVEALVDRGNEVVEVRDRREAERQTAAAEYLLRRREHVGDRLTVERGVARVAEVGGAQR